MIEYQTFSYNSWYSNNGQGHCQHEKIKAELKYKYIEGSGRNNSQEIYYNVHFSTQPPVSFFNRCVQTLNSFYLFFLCHTPWSKLNHSMYFFHSKSISIKGSSAILMWAEILRNKGVVLSGAEVNKGYSFTIYSIIYCIQLKCSIEVEHTARFIRVTVPLSVPPSCRPLCVQPPAAFPGTVWYQPRLQPQQKLLSPGQRRRLYTEPPQTAGPRPPPQQPRCSQEGQGPWWSWGSIMHCTHMNVPSHTRTAVSAWNMHTEITDLLSLWSLQMPYD